MSNQANRPQATPSPASPAIMPAALAVGCNLLVFLCASAMLAARSPHFAQPSPTALTIWVGCLINAILLIVFVARLLSGQTGKLPVSDKNNDILSVPATAARASDSATRLARVSLQQMERTIKEAGEKERAILTHASDVICSFDLSGRCIAMNPACRRLWGYEPEELIGKLVYELIAPADRQRLVGHVQSVLSKEIPREYELKTICKDGAIKDTLWSLHWSVEYGWVIGVIHDITTRKAAERLQAEFTAMVTHDLRSPLSTISVFVDMIEQQVYGPVPEGLQAASLKVKNLMTRLISLVDDILSLERIESKVVPLNVERVALAGILQDSIDTISGAAQQNKIKIECAPVTLQLEVDARRLTQVLSNLIANAIKYSPPGETVRVSVSEDEQTVTVSVADKGPGIDPAEREAIFEKFKQSASLKTKEGTGLGLAICKQLIEQHGGRIGVSEAAGGGSIFWFRLPKRTVS